MTSSTSSGPILAANANREEAIIFNNSSANLFQAFAATASAAAFTAKLVAGAVYVLPTPLYKGAIAGIWDASNYRWTGTRR